MRRARDDEAMESFQRRPCVSTPALHGHPITRGSSFAAGECRRGRCCTFKGPWRAGALDPQVFAALADALAMSSRYEEALYLLRQGARAEPGRGGASLQRRAHSHRQWGVWTRPSTTCEKPSGSAPDYARAHNNLGSALLMQKQPREAAIGHFQEAVRIDPGYTMARENLKDALAQKTEVRKSGR